MTPVSPTLLFDLLGFELVLLLLVAPPVLLHARQRAVAVRFAAGGGCVLAGALLLGARDTLGFEAAPLLTQALLLSGAGFVYRCMARLYELPSARLAEVVSPLVGFTVFAALWATDHSPQHETSASARVIATALPLAAFPVSWLSRMRARRPREVTIGTWYLVIGACVGALGSLSRAIAFAAHPMPDPMHSPFAGVAAAVGMATCLLMTCGLMLEAAARSHGKLRASNAQLQRVANTDPLTGVGNRRYFETAALQAVAAAREENRPVCVVLLDIDHFKGINDRHGHEAGDEVLRSIATMVSA